MPKKPETETFADIIEGTAPRVEDYSSAFAKENPPVPGSRKVPAAAPDNPYDVDYTALDYTFHHQVFVIWRPWAECGRCQAAIKAKRVELPEEGDYVCPHTHHADYVAAVQKFLSDGYIQQSRQESMLVDGSIQVSLGWLVPKINKQKIKELLRNKGTNTSEGSPL